MTIACDDSADIGVNTTKGTGQIIDGVVSTNEVNSNNNNNNNQGNNGNNSSNSVVETFSSFKANCISLENAISLDNIDPKEEIVKFNSWIEWVEYPTSPKDYAVYFYKETMLKVATAMLTKKYQNNDQHINEVKRFLSHIMGVVSKHILTYPVEMIPILKVLLNQKMPFYLKYGFPKLPPPVSNSVQNSRNVLTQSWKESITKQQVVDAKNAHGEWEVVIVEDISPTKTEIYVHWGNSTTSWISLDDATRVAPFGQFTDTSNSSDGAVAAEPIVVEPDDNYNQITEEDILLLTNLKPGCLVDAMDKSGTWYQACVMELREIFDDQVVKQPEDIALSELKKELFSLGSNKRSLETIEEIKEDTERESESRERLSSSSVQHPPPPPPSPTHSPIHVAVPEPSVNVPSNKSFARIAFIGLSEYYDEWIEVSDINKNRIRKLNSMSYGNRGEQLIRDEIKYLTNYYFKTNNVSEQVFANSRDEVLSSKFYVYLVNVFWNHHGIHSCISLMEDFEAQGLSCDAAKFAIMVELLSTLSQIAEVLCTHALQVFQGKYLNCFVACYQYLLGPGLRNTKIETVEEFLSGLENVQLYYRGNFGQAANDVVQFQLGIINQSISSNFLNRRLGGLKMLNDLFTRIDNVVQYPFGMKITRAKSSNDKLENVSYRLALPTTISSADMCQWIQDNQIFEKIYIGEGSHEALIQRSKELVKFLIKFGSLSVVSTIWQVAAIQKVPEAMQILLDIINDLPLNVLSCLLTETEAIKSSNVSVLLLDVVSGIAITCRDKLLTEKGAGLSESEIDDIFDVHNRSLSKIWSWGSDGSGVHESVFAKCVQKMESLIEMTQGYHSSQLLSPTFPWNRHLRRLDVLVMTAISSLNQFQTITLSLKVLRSFVMSWLKDDKDVAPDFNYNIVFKYPLRSAAVEYLESNYSLLKCMARLALFLKTELTNNSKEIIEDSNTFEIVNSSSSADRKNNILPNNELQYVINDMLVTGTRDGYRIQLESCLDFMIFLVRQTNLIEISFEIVEDLWKNILMKSITVLERDTVLNFVGKLVLQKVTPANGNGNDTKTVNEDVLVLEKFQKRLSFCRSEDVVRIFHELLCDPVFIESEHFGVSALTACQKYYRRICADNKFMEEIPGRELSSSFTIIKSMASENSWKVFLKIILTCADDTIATEALKYVTLLLQRISPHLVYQGELNIFRNYILTDCMNELNSINQLNAKNKNISYANVKSLKRNLMMLNAMLDESAADGGDRISPHGGKWRSKKLSVKMQYTTGKITQILETSSSCSVQSLLQRIAAICGKEIASLKFFRKGKEFTIGPRKQTLHQMEFANSEVIMVADRPQPAKPKENIDLSSEKRQKGNDLDNDSDTNHFDILQSASSIESTEVPIEFLPVYKLANTPEYLETLFALSDKSGGIICDELWDIISRLPTSQLVYHKWLSLPVVQNSEVSIFTELFTLGQEKISTESFELSSHRNKPLLKLLYNIQVLERLCHHDDSPTEELASKNWCQAFVDRGGVFSLLYAFEHTIDTLELFINSDSGLIGVTQTIMLTSLESLARILRGIFIRLIDYYRPNQLLQIYDQLSTINKLFATENIGEPDVINIDTSSSSVVAKASDEDKENILEGVANSFKLIDKSEWGNSFDNLNFQSLIDNLSFDKIVNFQSTILKFLSLCRDFSFMSMFYAEHVSTLLISQRQVIKDNQFSFMAVMTNYFTLWCSMVIFSPGIIGSLEASSSPSPTVPMSQDIDEVSSSSSSFHFEKVTLRKCLENLLIGKEDPLVKKEDYLKLSYLSKQIGLWAVECLVLFTQLVHTVNCPKQLPLNDEAMSLEINEDEEVFDGCLSLRSILLRVLIDMRPGIIQVCQVEEKEPRTPLSLTSAVHNLPFGYTGLYEMISRISSSFNHCLRDLVTSNAISISTFQLKCVEIWNEIESGSYQCAQSTLPCSGKFRPKLVTWSNIAGSLKFLTALISQFPEIREQSLRQLIPICIQLSLGLVKKSQIYLQVFCQSIEEIGEMYSCLKTFDDHRRQKEIYDFLLQSHQSMPLPFEWNLNPAKDSRSALGYVGLRNLGCTCYMNSLLQVLFMMPKLRYGVLGCKLGEVNNPRDSLVHQLQRMFSYLEHSTRKAFSPNDWAYAYKDEFGMPINVTHQQDAQEFLQILCDRVENDLRIVDENGTSKPVLQLSFGGFLSNQMLKEDDPSAMREMTEPFYCISLDVQGTGSLENSLQKFVTGERISDYSWEEGAPRVNIIKRQCISELSENVIFHLKRFEMNFDSFRREKVNDEFSFPQFIDLYPYSCDGLMNKGIQIRGKDYYFYELTAVIVHSGTADSGHYYSYIKESNELAEASESSSRRWIEFNDSEVTQFNESRISAECFGGMTSMTEYNTMTKKASVSTTINPKSAYMLVYSRVRRPLQSVLSSSEELLKVTEEDNREHLLSQRIYAKNHLDFCVSVFENLLDPSKDDFVPNALNRKEYVDIFVQYGHFLFSILSHSSHMDLLEQACNRLVSLMINATTRQVHVGSAGAGGGDNSMDVSDYNDSDDAEVDENDIELALALSLSSNITTADAENPTYSEIEKFLAVKAIVVQSSLELINKFNTQFVYYISSLFSPHREIRYSFAQLIAKLFAFALEENDQRESLIQVAPLLVKQETFSDMECLQKPNSELTYRSDLPICFQFLRFLTANALFASLGEQWRRADAYMWLLAELSGICQEVRYCLVSRETIAQLIDIFIGDMSPMTGALFQKGTRKRCPSSYIPVYPDKNGQLPSTVKNIPDWTDLLRAVFQLCRASNTDVMLGGRGVPPTLMCNRNAAAVLDPWSMRCLRSKTFFVTGLKQSRYSSYIIAIMEHMLFEAPQHVVDVCREALLEAFTFSTVDGLGYIFEAIYSFLHLSDSQMQQRIYTFLFGDTGVIPVLFSSQANKQAFVCVAIRSLMAIVMVNNYIFSLMKSRLQEWAPWMLKFCYQYSEKCSQEAKSIKEFAASTANAATAAKLSTEQQTLIGPQLPGAPSSTTNNNATPAASPKGSYLYVYGEQPDERELTWEERAQATFQALQGVITRMGFQPEVLIPADAFEEVAPEAISLPERMEVEKAVAASMNDDDGATKYESMLNDAMTDDDFEKFLLSQGGGGVDDLD